MGTRSSGKQRAARFTTVIAVGSFAVAGLGTAAVAEAAASHTSTTVPSGSNDGTTSQSPGSGKTTTPPQHAPGTVPVTPGNGGSVSGHSSGS